MKTDRILSVALMAVSTAVSSCAGDIPTFSSSVPATTPEESSDNSFRQETCAPYICADIFLEHENDPSTGVLVILIEKELLMDTLSKNEILFIETGVPEKDLRIQIEIAVITNESVVIRGLIGDAENEFSKGQFIRNAEGVDLKKDSHWFSVVWENWVPTQTQFDGNLEILIDPKRLETDV